MICVICLVSVMICILFTGHLRIVLIFAILTITPLISESLLGNTRVTMAILQKCLGIFSSKTSTISLTLIFRESVFNFDVRCVSRKFMSPPIQKWLLMRFILSVVLEKTVRFLTAVYAVLEEYNNCLPNNKWLDVKVKHVSIVSG